MIGLILNLFIGQVIKAAQEHVEEERSSAKERVAREEAEGSQRVIRAGHRRGRREWDIIAGKSLVFASLEWRCALVYWSGIYPPSMPTYQVPLGIIHGLGC